MSLNIAVDFDGVIADTPRFGVKLIREWHQGVEVPLRLYRHTKVEEVGFSLEKFEAMKRRLYGEEWPIPAMPGALHHIQELRAHGHHLHVVTSRSHTYLERARTLLEEYGLGDLPVRGVGKDASKVEACRGANVFIDDDLRKLEPMIGIVEHLVLFSWPFNEADVVPKGIIRLSGWPDIYDYIFHEVV